MKRMDRVRKRLFIHDDANNHDDDDDNNNKDDDKDVDADDDKDVDDDNDACSCDECTNT